LRQGDKKGDKKGGREGGMGTLVMRGRKSRPAASAATRSSACLTKFAKPISSRACLLKYLFSRSCMPTNLT
jgi:hypothetical protein